MIHNKFHVLNEVWMPSPFSSHKILTAKIIASNYIAFCSEMPEKMNVFVSFWRLRRPRSPPGIISLKGGLPSEKISEFGIF